MISALRVMVSALQAMISADRMVISARANGSIFLINGPTTTKFRHDNLLTSQNNFPTSLGNFIPSANNTRTLPHPSGNGRINGASKLHCCYELITEGPKFPSENRFGSRMLIQSSPTILVTVPSLARKIARSARLASSGIGFHQPVDELHQRLGDVHQRCADLS